MEPGPAPGPEPRTGPAVEPGPEPATGPGHEPVTDPVSVTDPVPVTDPAADPDVEPLHRGGFRCLLCQITAANRPSLLSHLAGKRHRRLRELRAERRAQELRSLFVSGFPRGTEPARLRQHFRAFGDVATVVMDKEKGAFAIVELREPAGAAAGAGRAPAPAGGGGGCGCGPGSTGPSPGPPPRDPPGGAPDPRGCSRRWAGPRTWRRSWRWAGGVPSLPSLPSLWLPQVEAQLVEAQLALLVRALELSAAERRLRALLLALLREALGEFLP
ncbi:speckle targeted PIP5K1A-regulated poly(A) polymerase-like, partial [Aphelocoma coerulescens]|uniref:speckle targeted PIP5K1A-regulated poly(A) polymerase-like n=1 Tax=Aphelocoma coerulescens TaxID=39617 RepID=UPI003604947B